MFSCFLKRAIAESGKTQRNIADESGITLSALANYLKGVRQPQVDVAEKLAKSCGYSLTFIRKGMSTNVDISNQNKSNSEDLTDEEIKALRNLLEKSKKSNSRSVG